MNGQYIEIIVNRESTLVGPVSTEIEMWFGRCYAKPTYLQPI